jgi:MoaA/NifB/PqqE/SkfB family radical SAM enzyme
MIDKLPPADFLVLQGVGEPTLHPNFNELVDTGLKSGKFAWVAFNTNGLARNDAFWIDLAKNKQCVVTLSIDSLDPAVAERCRAGTNAAQLFERLKLFRSLFPNFKISLVASKLNIDDIATTLERIAALGQGFAQIQEMISTQSELLLDKWDRARLTDDLAELRRKYPTFTVTTSSISSGLKKCVAPFVAPFITIDGFLAPCCAFVDARPYNFVSLLGDDDWDAVRSRPEVRAWQDWFLTEDPAPCKACSFNPARDAAATSPRGGRSFKTS